MWLSSNSDSALLHLHTRDILLVMLLQEARYRQRYLDGIVNHHHVRSIFVTRARIVQYVRKYLDDRQFLEVG